MMTLKTGLTAVTNGLAAISQHVKSCQLEPHQKTYPDHRDNHVWIVCGDHALIISSGTWFYQGKESPKMNIEEQIGDK